MNDFVVILGCLVVVGVASGASAAFSFLLWRAFSRAVSIDVLATLKTVGDRVAELHARKTPVSSSFESDTLDTLRRLDERVAAPPKPTLAPDAQPAYFDQLVREAYDVGEKMGKANAENGVKVTGRDKQREAISYLKRSLEAANLEDYLTLLTLKLEAEVARRKAEQ